MSCIESISQSFPYWSTFLLTHLSFYLHCFSVFLIYSSKAHHKFNEHLQSDPSVHVWRLPVRAAGSGADSWLFLALSLPRSACLSVTSPNAVHHKGENEREPSVCSSTGVPGRQCWSTWKHYSESYDWRPGQIPPRIHLWEGSRVATKASRFGCMTSSTPAGRCPNYIVWLQKKASFSVDYH